ncbi:hypothetical protein HNP81_000120 [Peribacillus huizhouensis]|uniref:ABC transporter permease n=1 Tax=Peribacillus huizhouensis TaxID=1501239 RepID=A0ABR6CJQ4_9BACI|nr:hypothetical protein [Peribacillus huizhouensis]
MGLYIVYNTKRDFLRNRVLDLGLMFYLIIFV